MFLPEATARLQCDDPEVRHTSRLVSNERLDLNHTGNINTLVSLEIPKFATAGAAVEGRPSESGH
jgi:hypothetical protein